MRAVRSSRRLSSSATRVGFGSLRLRGGAGVCEEHGFRNRWHLQAGLALISLDHADSSVGLEWAKAASEPWEAFGKGR